MRILTTIAVILTALLALPAMAAASEGPPSLCDTMPQLPQCDDGVDVSVDVPTDVECPTGGVVLVIGETRFPVCNGLDGADGAEGSDGLDGSSGFDGTSGVSGVAGSDGADGADLTGCAVSTRQTRIKLPKRLRGAKVVTVRYDGVKAKVRPKNGRVRVDFRGKPCGLYLVEVKKPGVRSALRAVYVNGALLTKTVIGGPGYQLVR